MGPLSHRRTVRRGADAQPAGARRVVVDAGLPCLVTGMVRCSQHAGDPESAGDVGGVRAQDAEYLGGFPGGCVYRERRLHPTRAAELSTSSHPARADFKSSECSDVIRPPLQMMTADATRP